MGGRDGWPADVFETGRCGFIRGCFPGCNLCECIAPLAETAGWIVLFAALFAGWAWYQTGSLSLIAPYLQGERLLFDPLHVVIDNAPPETVVERSVRVANLTSSDVTLLGSQASCGCIALDVFPIVIRVGATHDLKLKIGVPSVSGPFEHTVKIFSDDDGYDSVVVTVSGTDW